MDAEQFIDHVCAIAFSDDAWPYGDCIDGDRFRAALLADPEIQAACRLREAADFAQDKIRRLLARWDQLDDVAKRGTVSAVYHALDRGNPKLGGPCH